ncbi:GTP 3',8-cyclase MoaA [Alicyclobacillus vulcanalis]|uniref:GTP 3',8-cyclase n=1 Tax=Alicyclobacillus vulcanalis TaxID=252246 RepID=A0A1N7LHJ4_9BACL|nr:GTP 3',8-cyclase MoaA [Alicyclobacillus vulcanalis]SIS73302.1 cyclic pyranopterin phosphate synthase [Alicyclobacillus vulcanalis]
MARGDEALTDSLGRPLRDLRVSLTDRCNFRCPYCMPSDVFGPEYRFLPPDALMSPDEIAKLVRALVPLGLEKVRLTGGEPLLRREVMDIVQKVAEVPGIRDVAMTTNGSLLTREKAVALKRAGLGRITVSLDALRPDLAARMNGVKFPVSRVLAAVEAADAAGLKPVKVNVVVRRGWNEDEVVAIAERFRGTGVIVRFIEYMDVGTTNGWRMEDVVTADEILRLIGERFPLEALPPRREGEVATRYRYIDGSGEIGVIHSVSRPFCRFCTRLRVTAAGELYTCLFGAHGVSLRPLFDRGASEEDIAAFVADVWRRRRDRYSEIRSENTKAKPKVEMSRIGG